MPRTNKTDFAILGLLSLEPMSGYDMKAFISTSIDFFWQESYGQIYPALQRLLDEGSISRRVAPGKGRPDRHVYRITAKGRKRLAAWLAADTDPEPVRSELLLKLFFGPLAGPAIHERQIGTLLQHQKQRLRAFKEVERGILKEHETSPFHPYWYATLQFGVHVTRARVRWCRETLAWLRSEAAHNNSQE